MEGPLPKSDCNQTTDAAGLGNHGHEAWLVIFYQSAYDESFTWCESLSNCESDCTYRQPSEKQGSEKEIIKDRPLVRHERKRKPPAGNHTGSEDWRSGKSPQLRTWSKSQHDRAEEHLIHPGIQTLETANCCVAGRDGNPRCPHPADLGSNPTLSPPILYTWAGFTYLSLM